MDTSVKVNRLVDTLDGRGCKFMLVRNFKDVVKTRNAIRRHHIAVKNRRHRKIIVMAIFSETYEDYLVLVTTTYPLPSEVERFGFYPVKKDRANWVPIQYKNRKGKEHLNSRDGDYEHTTNYIFIAPDELKEMLIKDAKLRVIYK